MSSRNRSLESDIKALASYRQLCDTAEPKYKVHCSPGISMANWVFPLQEPDGQDQRLHLNGTGLSAGGGGELAEGAGAHEGRVARASGRRGGHMR